MIDKIVAVISHKFYVLIFKESGKIYKMQLSEISGRVEFKFLANVPE